MANIGKNKQGLGVDISWEATAKTFGRTGQDLRKMIDDGCPLAQCPPHSDLRNVANDEIKFNTYDVFMWVVTRAREDGKAVQAASDNQTIDRLQSRLHKAEAELAQRQLPGPKPRAPTDYDDARARATAAQADLRELDLRKKRAEVVAIDDVMYTLSDQLANVRTRLLAIPARVAPSLIGQTDQPTIISVVRKECISALAELSVDEHPYEEFLDEKDRPGFIDGLESNDVN